MTETCGYCDYHAWSDPKEEHICLLASGAGREMSLAGSCDRFKSSRRGYVGCTDPAHQEESTIGRHELQ